MGGRSRSSHHASASRNNAQPIRISAFEGLALIQSVVSSLAICIQYSCGSLIKIHIRAAAVINLFFCKHHRIPFQADGLVEDKEILKGVGEDKQQWPQVC